MFIGRSGTWARHKQVQSNPNFIIAWVELGYADFNMAQSNCTPTCIYGIVVKPMVMEKSANLKKKKKKIQDKSAKASMKNCIVMWCNSLRGTALDAF